MKERISPPSHRPGHSTASASLLLSLVFVFFCFALFVGGNVYGESCGSVYMWGKVQTVEERGRPGLAEREERWMERGLLCCPRAGSERACAGCWRGD